jgi:hypothetical protein
MPRSPLPRRREAATPDARRLGCAAAGLLLLALSSAGGARAQGTAAVETDGFGTLTKCRSWLVLHTCHTYDRVTVPERIDLGDRIVLRFGSNRKQYRFPVERIARGRESCTLYSEKDETQRGIDRIEISPCRSAVTGPASPAK